MVIIGIAIYLALRIIKVDKPLMMATALGWLPVCAIFFCGLIITIAPGIHSFPVGKGLANGAISCIELFAYILAFRLVNEKRLSPMQSFG
ncbi:MAG: hypothetical protein IKF96_05670, partial [Eggerthellaceae bacterium]|nr:hypothetical protein [Eggerthellaceae bacterium]